MYILIKDKGVTMEENKTNDKENRRKRLEEDGIKYIPLEGTEFKLIDVNSISFDFPYLKESLIECLNTLNQRKGFHGIHKLMRGL